MRIRIVSMLVAALLIVACSHGAGPSGTVDGRFSMPGKPTSELRLAGLNFSRGSHGHGHGQTVRVDTNGRYVVALAPGDYSVIGALSGPAERCAATLHVVVIAHKTTRADFACHAVPATPPKRTT